MKFDSTLQKLVVLRSEILGASLVLVDPATAEATDVWGFRDFTQWTLPSGMASLTALDGSTGYFYMLLNDSNDNSEEGEPSTFPTNDGLKVVVVDLQTRKQVGNTWTNIPSQSPVTGVAVWPAA